MLLACAKDELAFQANQANSQVFLGFQLTFLGLASPVAAAWWNGLKSSHTAIPWHAGISLVVFLVAYASTGLLVILQLCHVRYKRIETFSPDEEACRFAQEEGASQALRLERVDCRDHADKLISDIVRLRLAERMREIAALHRRANREKKNLQRLTAAAIMIMVGGLILEISQGFSGPATRTIGSLV